MIKLFYPYISWKAVYNVVKVLLGTQLAEGPQVKKFEKEFSKKFNLENVLAVNSGTTALELAYELADIEEGDEVITPILTCTATNLPLVRRKAKIIFADIDRDLNVSIEDIKQKITPNTKAIVFVHFGGNNRGLLELLKIGKEKNIKIIEDAAQAVGSGLWGLADFTAVSLQAIKTLTSGDGGFLICKDAKDYEKAKRLRWFGYDREKKQKEGDTDLLEAGYKYHMNDITAAIGIGNLEMIDSKIEYRIKLIMEYRKYGINANMWFAWIEVNDIKKAQEIFKKYSIETGQHHYRNDKYTIFGKRQKFPIMDYMENRYLLLPLHHKVKIRDIKKIAMISQYAKI